MTHYQVTRAKNTSRQPLRFSITQDVRDAAKDAGDDRVVAACRRALTAWTFGRKANRADTTLIYAFAEMLSQARADNR